MKWLKLRCKDISPVERWIKDRVVLQMTALPDSQLDAMDRLRFYQENPSLTVKGDASDDIREEQRQIWSKVCEILFKGGAK